MPKCGETCEHPYPAPDFVRALNVPCARYAEWLEKQAQSCRQRDARPQKPGIDAYRERIHKAVLCSEGRDFYTGELLEWNRLNHDLPLTGGRRRHLQRGPLYRHEQHGLPHLQCPGEPREGANVASAVPCALPEGCQPASAA